MFTLYATGRFPFPTLPLKAGEAYTVATDWTAKSHVECGWACWTKDEALGLTKSVAATAPKVTRKKS